MPTPNVVDRILARLKEGLLINLDKHSLERARQIFEEETGEKATPPKPQEHFKNVPAPAAPTPIVAAPNQAFNDAIAKQKAEKAEALGKTAAGEGMSDNSARTTGQARVVKGTK